VTLRQAQGGDAQSNDFGFSPQMNLGA
jgi:hypothetical protein